MTITQFTAARAAASSCHSSADFLGRFPDIAPWELEDVWAIHDDYSIATVRALSGLTQAEFAEQYHIPPRTIENWTQSGEARREISPYLLDLLAVDVINTRATKRKEEKMRKKKIYMVRVDNFRGKGGMVRNDKFFFGYGEAAEYELKEKDKAISPENGDNIIVRSEEFEVEVPDGYEITTAGRLAFDMRITSQEPDWED